MSNGGVIINVIARDHSANESGGGSSKNISDGGGGGSDPHNAGVAHLETEIKELKSKIDTDSKDMRTKVDTVVGKMDQLKYIWGAILLFFSVLSGAYIYTNKVSEDVRRLEVSIASSRPQQPPNAR
jgi:nicotinate-nucleotide pyrophosphorylase